METINVISKVRFSSARPQTIQLHAADDSAIELLCMEPGQKVDRRSGQWAYYVITGTVSLTSNGQNMQISDGHLATTGPDEPHTIANTGQQRLVCLSARGPSRR